MIALLTLSLLGQFAPPVGNTTGAQSPASVTTPFVDAGTVAAQSIAVGTVDGGIGLFTTSLTTLGPLVASQSASLNGSTNSAFVLTIHSANGTNSFPVRIADDATNTKWYVTNANDTLKFAPDSASVVVTIDNTGAMHLSSSKSAGAITLSGGTGTATVLSGVHCTCQNTSGAVAAQCAVSATTLTATKGALGGDTDVISYVCL